MTVEQVELKEQEVLRSKYKVLKLIGTGGMSKVYLASDISHPSQKWAVKVTHSNHPLFKRIIQEATLLSELDHPSIPQIADFFSSKDGQDFYLIQEYLEGETLLSLSKSGNLSLEEILEYSIQVCDCLYYLHNLKPDPIIYRDIKPGNIIVGKDGKVKLIDFGIARKYREDQFHDTVQIGTVGFAAPEQFEKKQTDQRTDIFSFGAMLYYLLTNGKYVYISQKPVTHFRKDLPDPFVEILEKMVQIEPDERPSNIQTVKEILEDVQGRLKEGNSEKPKDLMEQKKIVEAAPVQKKKGRHKLVYVGILILFFLLIAVYLFR